ncbi:MAG: iron-containing alcohol dehydrogenase [Oscillospiraceae bacterium]|jgi:alcohol dehydrogenase YqhD (iron-dependent ADH family)|nr:iron-containing alcohol dehydrogenase [Oscillospiraceae bacterium]
MKTFTNFSFHMYTEILFGRNTETEVARLIRKYGGTKVMLVYGGGSIKKIGLYDTVAAALSGGGIPFVELGGVQPNPRRSLVEKGLKTAQAEGVDFLLGVGGGSAIDTAKAIALGLANDGNYWQFYSGTKAEKMAPVGTIHTIAAAGSETSGSSVLLNDIGDRHKRGFTYVACRPVFAIMNPALTCSVSRYQTGAGSADIFAHTVSRYFTASSSRLGDEYCEGTLRTVVKYAPVACANPNDYEARAELMLAGSFSHNDVTGIGRADPARGGEHGLEAQLSGTYDTAHGAGLAVVMPAWLQYITDHGTPEQAARVAQFGVKVFGADPDMGDVKATANDGLKRFRAWLSAIGMPLTLKELGVPKEDLRALVDKCNCGPDGILRGYMDLDKNAVAAIFSSVLE